MRNCSKHNHSFPIEPRKTIVHVKHTCAPLHGSAGPIFRFYVRTLSSVRTRVSTHVFSLTWKCRLETGPLKNLGLCWETPGLPWRGAPGTDSMLGDGRTFPVKKTGISPGKDGEGTSMLEGLLRARKTLFNSREEICPECVLQALLILHIGFWLSEGFLFVCLSFCLFACLFACLLACFSV